MDKETKKIIDKVIHNEGGYNNDHEDLGGETKYGISKRNVDMAYGDTPPSPFRYKPNDNFKQQSF